MKKFENKHTRATRAVVFLKKNKYGIAFIFVGAKVGISRVTLDMEVLLRVELR